MKSLASIAAVGALTPLGQNSLQTAFSHRAGATAVSEAPLRDQNGEAISMCWVQTLDEFLLGPDRLIALGMSALRELFDDLGDTSNALRMDVALCLGEELSIKSDRGVPLAQEIGETIARNLQTRAAEISVRPIAHGPAGPGFALPDICQNLARGAIDAAVLVGIHSDYHPDRIAALEEQGRLFSPANPYAVLPGEAAAAVLLTRPDIIRRLHLRELSELWSIATAHEKARPDNDEPAFVAQGLTQALRALLSPLHGEGCQSGYCLTDLGFETFRFFELQAATTRLSRFFCEPQAFEHPAQRMGNLGAAALPVHIALASEAYTRGYAPHPYCTCIAGSDGGDRAALLLSQPND